MTVKEVRAMGRVIVFDVIKTLLDLTGWTRISSVSFTMRPRGSNDGMRTLRLRMGLVS